MYLNCNNSLTISHAFNLFLLYIYIGHWYKKSIKSIKNNQIKNSSENSTKRV